MCAKFRDLKKTHAVNSWLNLILSTLIVFLVFVSIVINLLAEPTEVVEEVGTKTFRMFTVLSNMFVGFATAMTIPFAVDGIREKNYHLPRWIVNLNFSSVSCISLTFLVALTILSPRAGFYEMMGDGNNLFLHTIVPVLSIVSFLFINAYHTIKFKTTFLAMAPMLAYSIAYLIMAIFIGEDNGGWRDHYRFEELMPWYYILIIMLLLTFGIACLLRAIHNDMHRRDKIATGRYYQTAAEYDFPTIEEAIRKLANDNKAYDVGGEVIVPRRIIKFLDEKYQSQKPLSYLCGIYLEEYLK
jgi:hypothetical protein